MPLDIGRRGVCRYLLADPGPCAFLVAIESEKVESDVER